MKDNSFLKMMLDMFFEFADIKVKYNEIKSNEESKKVSTLLAKKSIKFSIIAIILTALAGLMVFGGIKLLDGILFALGIILIAMAVATMLYVIGYYILSLISIIRQFLFNKKGCSIFALILNILTILAVVGAIIFVLLMI